MFSFMILNILTLDYLALVYLEVTGNALLMIKLKRQ